jgi:hypothetical protein
MWINDNSTRLVSFILLSNTKGVTIYRFTGILRYKMPDTVYRDTTIVILVYRFFFFFSTNIPKPALSTPMSCIRYNVITKMAACAYELVKTTKAKSSVWNRFSLKREFSTNTIDKTVAVCNLCKTEIKHAGGTTNLSTHLRRHHPNNWCYYDIYLVFWWN